MDGIRGHLLDRDDLHLLAHHLVLQSVNKGLQSCLSHPKSGVAKSIRQLSEILVETEEEVSRRRG